MSSSSCSDNRMFIGDFNGVKLPPGATVTVQPNTLGIVEYDSQKRWVNDSEINGYMYDRLDGVIPLIPEHVIPYIPQAPTQQEEMPQLIEDFKQMLEHAKKTSTSTSQSNFSLYREDGFQIVSLSLAGVNPDDISVTQVKRDFIIEYKLVKHGKVTTKKEKWTAAADDLAYNDAYVTYEFGMLNIMIPIESFDAVPRILEIKRVKK